MIVFQGLALIVLAPLIAQNPCLLITHFLMIATANRMKNVLLIIAKAINVILVAFQTF